MKSKKLTDKKTFFIVHFTLIFIIILALVIASILTNSTSLIFGFIIGVLGVFFIFLMDDIFLQIILYKGRRSAISLIVIKFVLSIIFIIILTWVLFAINAKSIYFYNAELNDVINSKINLFTYLLGLSSIFISIIIDLVVKKIIKRKRKEG